MKPEGSKVNYQELAERFYTLDTEVYEASGSKRAVSDIAVL